MLEHAWDFLSDAENQATLAWIGGGISALVGAVWTVSRYILERKAKDKVSAEKDHASLADTDGSVIGGSFSIKNNILIIKDRLPKSALLMLFVGFVLCIYAYSITNKFTTINSLAFFGYTESINNSDFANSSLKPVDNRNYPVGTIWNWQTETGDIIESRVTELDGSFVKIVSSDGCIGQSDQNSYAGGGYWHNCAGSSGRMTLNRRTGTIFPLKVGSFESSILDGEFLPSGKKFQEERHCSVAEIQHVSVPAGTFETYRIVCVGKWNHFEYNFAPNIGTEILSKQREKDNNKTKIRRLVNFERG